LARPVKVPERMPVDERSSCTPVNVDAYIEYSLKYYFVSPILTTIILNTTETRMYMPLRCPFFISILWSSGRGLHLPKFNRTLPSSRSSSGLLSTSYFVCFRVDFSLVFSICGKFTRYIGMLR